MPKSYLDAAYGLSDGQSVRDFYDEWAETYDEELTHNAYATPARVAEALERTDTPRDARILDFGCGTGLSGLALVRRGYTLLDGTDLSDRMLAAAEAHQVYGRLWTTDPAAPLPVWPGQYDVIAAVGVISPGAGPADLLAALAERLDPGGRLAFSFNDRALADPAYTEARDALLASGTVVEQLAEHGEHLPGAGMKSTIYVLEKT